MDDDDNNDEHETDRTHADAVRRVLDEHDVDAERALVVLARVLVGRHVDVELRKRGRRAAFSIGNERANALTAALDALFQAQHRAAGPTAPRAADRDEPGDDAGNADRAAGEDAGEDLADVRQALIALLTACQFVGERAAGLDEDDDPDDRPAMRIVRE